MTLFLEPFWKKWLAGFGKVSILRLPAGVRVSPGTAVLTDFWGKLPVGASPHLAPSTATGCAAGIYLAPLTGQLPLLALSTCFLI